MKILIVNSLDSRYGSTYRIRRLYDILKGSCETVYLESNLESPGQNEISVKQSDNILGFVRANIKRLYIALTLKYDVLFVQKFLPLTAPCILAAKLRKKKIVVDWDDIDKELQKNWIRGVAVAFTEWLLPRFADHITTHSNYIEGYSRDRTKARVSIVNQGVDFDLFDPDKVSNDRIKSEFDLVGKFIAGHLCTLTEGGARDIDIIFSAVSKLYEKYRDIRLFIVGGGPKEKEVLAIAEYYDISEIIRVTGILDQAKIPEYISCFDVSLIYMRDNPGNRARVSFKVLESLAMNKKVIGHVVGETAGRFGRFIDHTGEDAQGLFAKLYSVYNDKGKIISARENLKNDYSWQSIGAELIKIFNEIEGNLS